MRSPLLITCALTMASAPALAGPPAVYINGVRVDGLHGVSLSQVDVKFEDNGDIRITAPRYKIEPAAAPPASASAGAPAPSTARGKRFFIVPQPQARPGAAQWDIDVQVNGAFVARLRSRDPAPYVEITSFLRKGQNQIVYLAHKESGERVSVSPENVFEIDLGDGDLVDGRPSIARLNAYRLTAAETGERKTEFALELP